jgi:DtxR family Mn-dependent transcriptional regulator
MNAKTKRTKNVEEAVGIIWTLRERNDNTLEKVHKTLDEGVCEDVFENLIKDGLILTGKERVELTAEGEEVGLDITRRHRLAERLLADVLEVNKPEIDKNACELEHVISSDVADAICTLLGHPRQCPHGFYIPPGECCKKAGTDVGAIVMTLDKMKVGEKGRVVYLVSAAHQQIHKLLSLGLVPGVPIHLHQKTPSYVVDVGHTQIALDEETAKQINVRCI